MRDYEPAKKQELYKDSLKLRQNMTKEERHLWYDFLKNCPVQFNRQKEIGNYIVDFYCDKAKLVIEIDGSQQVEEVEQENDKSRTNFLSRLGLEGLRIPKNEIWDSFSSVCETIDQLVKERQTLISQLSADSFSR